MGRNFIVQISNGCFFFFSSISYYLVYLARLKQLLGVVFLQCNCIVRICRSGTGVLNTTADIFKQLCKKEDGLCYLKGLRRSSVTGCHQIFPNAVLRWMTHSLCIILSEMSMIILSIYKNTYKNLQEYCKNIARISQCLLFSPSAFRILLESDEDRLLVVFNRGLILMTEVFLLLILINSLLFLPI